MAAVWVYVTAADQAEAERLGRAAVEARLAACANLLGLTTAVYWWQGKVESGSEVALVLKTRADLVDALSAKIVELHSYDCPCVVALPIAGGNPEFLQWIEDETAAL